MKIDLKELEELASAATMGPWSTYDATACNGDFSHVEIAGADGTVIVSDDAGPGHNDSYFIAAANPAAVLQLIALASAAAVPPVMPQHIEEIKDLLLWPVTEDDARVARDMLQSLHFDLSMQEVDPPQNAQASDHRDGSLIGEATMPQVLDSRAAGNAQAALSNEQIGSAILSAVGHLDRLEHIEAFAIARAVEAAILAPRQPAQDASQVAQQMGIYGEQAVAPVAAAAQGDALPLPTKRYEFTSAKDGWFTGEQMRDFYQQGRAAGIEEAAKLAQDYAQLQLDPDRLEAVQDCAAAIRALTNQGG